MALHQGFVVQMAQFACCLHPMDQAKDPSLTGTVAKDTGTEGAIKVEMMRSLSSTVRVCTILVKLSRQLAG